MSFTDAAIKTQRGESTTVMPDLKNEVIPTLERMLSRKLRPDDIAYVMKKEPSLHRAFTSIKENELPLQSLEREENKNTRRGALRKGVASGEDVKFVHHRKSLMRSKTMAGG